MINEFSLVPSGFIETKAQGPVTKGFDAYHNTKDAVFSSMLHDPSMQFVIHKTSQGQSMQDDKVASRTAMIRQSKKPLGLYHFWEPGVDPVAQMTNFFHMANPLYKKGDMILLDWEKKSLPPHSQVEPVLKMLQLMEKNFGFTPGIYSGPYFLQEAACDNRFAKYYLWLSQYGPAPMLPKNCPWREWKIWQYTSTPEDTSVFNGDLNALKKFMGIVA